MAALGLVSCQDDSYDLSNIDEGVKVQVNNLVVPIRLEEIELDEILDIPEDSRIEKVKDPDTDEMIYAIKDSGKFEATGNLEIPEVRITRPNVNISQNDIAINLPSYINGYPEKLKFSDVKKNYGISDDSEFFTFSISKDEAKGNISLNADNVDENIREVSHLTVNATMKIVINLGEIVRSVSVDGITFTLPKGLDVTASSDYTYTKENGELKIKKLHDLEVQIPITGIDVKKAGGTLENGKLTLERVCNAAGTVSVKVRDINPESTVGQLKALNKINFSCNITFNEENIVVNKFSGRVKYNIDIPSIDPISLEDLPEFLTKEDGEANLILADPRIYLAVNTPVFSKGNDNSGAKVNATLALSSEGGNSANVTISTNKERSYFCLSPEKKDNPHFSFNPNEDIECEYHEFPGLGTLLSATKDNKYYIPSSLDFKLDAEVPESDVKDFALGNFGKASVDYVFFAPLKFESSSFVKYRKNIDGWFDDNDEELTITSLAVEASVIKDVAIAVDAIIEPIDKNGNKINGLKGTTSLSAETGKPLPLSITIYGNMKNVNGIILSITAKAGSGEALSPNMKIKVNNLKARVSGYYQNNSK